MSILLFHPDALTQEYQPHQTAFLDFIGLMQVCVENAQDAALQGRRLAAQGLFQTANNFYDRAAVLIEHSEDSFLRGRLTEAQRQLETCARLVKLDS